MKLMIDGSPAPQEQMAAVIETWTGDSVQSRESCDFNSFPQQIGRYEVLEELGRGGQGVVYRCRDVQLQRDVAIKVATTAVTDGLLSRLAQEGALLAQIDHPGLAHVYDAGVREQHPYLVMEYVPAGTLRTHVEQQGVTLREIRRIIRDVSTSLSAAHQLGILHLDLKPENVLVLPNGRCKLIDFGLGWLLKETGLPELPLVMGTAGYLAPEQASGRTARWSVATDIYGLGKVLQFLLSMLKRPSFSWFEQRELCRLQRICDQAIAVDPQQRFANVTQFADAVSFPERLRSRCLGAASILIGVVLFILGISLGRVVTLPKVVPHSSAIAALEPRFISRLKLDLSIITPDGTCPYVEIWTPTLGMIPLTGLTGSRLAEKGRMEWLPGTRMGTIGGDLRDRVLVVMAFARSPEFARPAISKELSAILSKADLSEITGQQSWTFSPQASTMGSEAPFPAELMTHLREEFGRHGTDFRGVVTLFPKRSQGASLEIRLDLCPERPNTPPATGSVMIDATCCPKRSCNSSPEPSSNVLDR